MWWERAEGLYDVSVLVTLLLLFTCGLQRLSKNYSCSLCTQTSQLFSNILQLRQLKWEDLKLFFWLILSKCEEFFILFLLEEASIITVELVGNHLRELKNSFMETSLELINSVQLDFVLKFLVRCAGAIKELWFICECLKVILEVYYSLCDFAQC